MRQLHNLDSAHAHAARVGVPEAEGSVARKQRLVVQLYAGGVIKEIPVDEPHAFKERAGEVFRATIQEERYA